MIFYHIIATIGPEAGCTNSASVMHRTTAEIFRQQASGMTGILTGAVVIDDGGPRQPARENCDRIRSDSMHFQRR
jgi:hypothetical protein